MQKEKNGQLISEVVDHPSFERIRGEILSNVTSRNEEAQHAFTGLATFCGLMYSGATIAILGYIGSRSAIGVPYFSAAALVFFTFALTTFAYLYYRHSQLLAGRAYFYATVAHRFFTRSATLEEVIDAGSKYGAKSLYRLIFWVPMILFFIGFALAILGTLGIGPHLPKPFTGGVKL